MLIFSVLIFQTGCKKSIIDTDNPEIMNITPKSSQNTDDSLLCVRIEAFLDSIDRNGSANIEYDSATYYLEASVNYHYGRADRKYGYSLVDSFDVILNMITYDKTNYTKSGNTRDDIIDGLKDIYDDIDNDKKFMVFAMVKTIEHTSTMVKYRIYSEFGWGDYIEFDEDEPYNSSKSGNWQTEAPDMIKNAALALYGYEGIFSGENSGFYTDIVYRHWQYFGTTSPYWGVYKSEIYPYPFVTANIVNHYTQTNYMDYYIFWQKHYLFNPPVGIHTVLNNQELNYYVTKINYGLNIHSYGNPGSDYYFMGLYIYPHTNFTSNNEWEYNYYNHVHYFGKPRLGMEENYQLELEDWGI